jgi:hypothetical protein
MTQFNKDSQQEYNRIFNGSVPRSMRDGGTNLDSACGDIEEVEAGRGLDSISKQLARDYTEFRTPEQTTQIPTKRWPNFPEGGALMSEAGQEIASFTAPSNPYEVRTTSTPAVKEKK